MHDGRFDELTKLGAAPVSRRKAMKAFLVGGATGAVALLQAPSVEATPGRCRKVKAICRQDYECCSNFCDPTTGRCACAPGTSFCAQSRQCVRCRGAGPAAFNPDTCQCECDRVGKVNCDPFTCCEDLANTDTNCCPGYYGGYFCNYYYPGYGYVC
jgi:hypothetical protein